MKIMPKWLENLKPCLKTEWIMLLEKLDEEKIQNLQEIRFRSGRGIFITAGGNSEPLAKNSNPVCSAEDLESVFLAACDFSPASRIGQIQNGYVMMRGGLRMGIAGHCHINAGNVERIFPVSSLNIRILQEKKGIAASVVKDIREKNGIHNTLIIAPPGSGKTTMLRDMIRLLSDGYDGAQGIRVGIADERGELACCVNGIPAMDIGRQSDVVDGCSKAWGMLSLIRSMGPQVVAVDEIGTAEDAAAVGEAVRCGVNVIATAHGSGIEDMNRMILRTLLEERVFTRAVILGAVPGSKVTVKALDAS